VDQRSVGIERGEPMVLAAIGMSEGIDIVVGEIGRIVESVVRKNVMALRAIANEASVSLEAMGLAEDIADPMSDQLGEAVTSHHLLHLHP
jgi:hypothetical protein